ncbi:Uncharacterised protein [Mycobacteroides abscessus subsp. abscessus]|nr:Uncharacterised protein [Mycobacteroides abscessus subsp. abscessus]
MACVRMKPPRVLHIRRSTSLMCVADGFPMVRSIHGVNLGPSFRKKNTRTIRVNSVTSTEVAVPTPLNTPEAMVAELDCNLLTIA